MTIATFTPAEVHAQAVALRDYFKATPDHWTTGSLALIPRAGDDPMESDNPLDPKACSHCLIGGVSKVTGVPPGRQMSYKPIVATQLGQLVRDTIVNVFHDFRAGAIEEDELDDAEIVWSFNDDRGYKAVLKLLDAVVERGATAAGVTSEG